MYRRIELINNRNDVIGMSRRGKPVTWGEDFKHGLMGFSHNAIVDAWVNDLRGPGKRHIPQNCRFFFTEKGWDKIGRNVIAACNKVGQDYRVIAIKETDAQVVWHDKHTDYEVAVQPKSRRNR